MATNDKDSKATINLSRRDFLGLAGTTGAVLAMGSSGSARAAEVDPAARSTALDTRLVTEYGARVPIVSAGMAFVSLVELPVAVTNAGGIGTYGAAPEPPPVVDARLSQIRAAAQGPFGVNFIIASSGLGDFTTAAHIEIAAAHRVPVVSFHWDVPPRDWIDRLHAAGSRVWVQAHDLDFARRALENGADGIVAQGKSAGGHNRNSTIPTIALVRMVRAQLSGECLLLAAGGIADGPSLVAALGAGADGGWIGTRFVAARESHAHPEYKARLAAAKGPRATAFSSFFGPEWPGQQQRLLRNRAVDSPFSTDPPVIGSTLLFPGVVGAPYSMPKYSAVIPTRDTQGDLEEMDMPCGAESVLHVSGEPSAAEIVAEIVSEAAEILASGYSGL